LFKGGEEIVIRSSFSLHGTTMKKIANRVFILLCLIVTSASYAAETNLYVPGVANLEGANNTYFATDLVLTNLTGASTEVTVTFIAATGVTATPARITLAPRQSVVYTNALQSIWNLSGIGGALQVQSNSAVAVRARTYNRAANGSFGLSLPIVTSDQMISVGEQSISPWVSESFDRSIGFRTNVGVIFPDNSGGTATVLIHNAAGAEIGRKTFSADTKSFQQAPVASFAPPRDIARMTLSVERGRAQAYTSVVDNITGDSSVFLSTRPPVGAINSLVSGVARLAGLNNTFFKTDLRIVNPTDSEVTVTVHYYQQSIDNTAAVTEPVTVRANETLEITDALAALFNLPEGSSGALRFTSSAPVLIAARTSTFNRSGAPGTYGAQQEAVPLSSFSRSSNVLTGVAHDVDSRTNIGLSSGSDGADLLITLRDPHGVLVRAIPFRMVRSSWTQMSASAFFNEGTIAPGSTIDISPTSGSYVAYISVVDQRSGDASVSGPSDAGCDQDLQLSLPERVCRTFNMVVAVPGTVGASYDWVVNGGNIVSGQGTPHIEIEPGSGTSLTVSVRVDSNGCIAYDTQTIAVDPPLTVAITRASDATVGRNAELEWTVSGAAESIELSGTDFPQPVVLPGTARTYSYTTSNVGTKSVTVTAINSCGSYQATASYTIRLSSEGPGSNGTGGSYPGLQTFAGARGREYQVYIPQSYDPQVPTPLVFALGGQGEPAAMTLEIGWKQIADRDNVIVATMTAATSGPGYSGAYDVAEFETIEQAELEILQRYNVALRSVYYWGFSAGAHVTYMFALERDRSTRLAAFAIQAGAIEAAATRVNPPSWPPQSGARRLPVFISCGQKDTSGTGGGLIGALRRNSEMLAAQGYPVTTREVPTQPHTYTSVDVSMAWKFLKEQHLAQQ
jgi:hypothetical protein